MQKDRSYHESAIEYNEELAEFAEELSEKLKSKYGEQEPVRWSLSVAKQHRFHAGRHRKALQKLENQNVKTVNTEDGGEDRVVDDERVVHRSAVSGEFVSEQFADNHPRTTTEEHVNDSRTEAERKADEVEGVAYMHPGNTEISPAVGEEEAADHAAMADPSNDGTVQNEETPAQTAERLQRELNNGEGV